MLVSEKRSEWYVHLFLGTAQNVYNKDLPDFNCLKTKSLKRISLNVLKML